MKYKALKWIFAAGAAVATGGGIALWREHAATPAPATSPAPVASPAPPAPPPQIMPLGPADVTFEMSGACKGITAENRRDSDVLKIRRRKDGCLLQIGKSARGINTEGCRAAIAILPSATDMIVDLGNGKKKFCHGIVQFLPQGPQ